jgi:RNA polymerase sigma-70 factor (ECF subfamily)
MIVYMQLIESDEDKSKFEQIYLKYRNLMFYVARKILSNQQDAEDAVHQAFVSIIENLEKISDVGSPKTRSYIVIIVERKAIDLIRKNEKVVSMESIDAAAGIEISLPDDGSISNAFANLPARYREVLLLHYDNGYSTKEIAQMFQMKRPAVQKLLWRAKNALQEILDKEGVVQ